MKHFLNLLPLLLIIGFTACTDVQQPHETGTSGKRSRKEQQVHPGPATGSPTEAEVLDRHPDKLILTKHARCRMECRHIDESEIREILEKGAINYRKSEPNGKPDPKYAVEGTTHDGQPVRIIFAPAKRGMVVITVIDLKTEWACDCR